VPVVGTDAHLPAVLAAALHADALRARLGDGAVFSPELMMEPRMVDRPLRDAAVLVPIVLRAEGPQMLLTQRTPEMKSHSGQVAFAGGKVDESDANAEAAALREAWEEIGLEARHVEVIGSLPHYTTGTAFRITPVVALVQPTFELKINPGEVAQAFEVPLAYLMNPANHRRHEVVWDFGDGPLKREWFSMPYPDEQGHFIWGATAGMIRNLYRRLI
jgi:8-oxo-dGTP pyrophosphatase MutT (NUDIX family)